MIIIRRVALQSSPVYFSYLRTTKPSSRHISNTLARPGASAVHADRLDLTWQLVPNSFSNGVMKTKEESPQPTLRYADVGINLSDPVYRGIYHTKQAHQDDLFDVIHRATSTGCTKMMVTGSNLIESQNAIAIAKQYPSTCYATVGIHPCSTQDFDKHPDGPAALLAELKDLAIQAQASGQCVALGEIGLDYDRVFLSPAETQRLYFTSQLRLATSLSLPLFLHSRAAHSDFLSLLTPHLPSLPRRGLVHSFTGTLDEALSLIALGFHIGINGCSLKTAENLEVVRGIPLSHMQIETDGPWCEMRASHASSGYLKDWPGKEGMAKSVKKEKWVEGAMIKGRNEPCTIGAVAWVVAGVKGCRVEEVVEECWRNSVGMFRLGVEEVGKGEEKKEERG